MERPITQIVERRVEVFEDKVVYVEVPVDRAVGFSLLFLQIILTLCDDAIALYYNLRRGDTENKRRRPRRWQRPPPAGASRGGSG